MPTWCCRRWKTERTDNMGKGTIGNTEEWIRRPAVKLLILTLAAFLIAFNTKTFINAGDLMPGGLTGITLLIQRIGKISFGKTIPFSPVHLVLNSIPIYIGFKYLGKKLTAWSLYVVVLSSVLVDWIPAYPITYDILLISIFGAILGGIGGSLCLWVDATGGGTDFIATYLSLKRGIDAWNIILGFNVILLFINGWIFGWDKALYSIIYQYVYTQVVHTIFRKYQQETLFIVTEYPDEVAKEIYQITHHGATILSGKGSYMHGERNVLYSVVSRGEVRQVMQAIIRIDPKAFVNAIRTEQLKGRFYQKPTQ